MAVYIPAYGLLTSRLEERYYVRLCFKVPIFFINEVRVIPASDVASGEVYLFFRNLCFLCLFVTSSGTVKSTR